jgi:hypothetical protein
MRALLVGVTLAALGCGSDSGADDGPCSLTDPCSDGAVCDMTDPAGPICIPADGDLDGDGLTNDHDFCNHQEGGQYDEDQDGIGDDCDRCPIAAPRSAPDSDNDGVDAPCDPEPGADGDSILLFDGFNSLDPKWTPSTDGLWSVIGGEMIADLSTDGDQQYLKMGIVGMNALALEASFRVDALETSNVRHLVGVTAVDPRPAGVSQVACYVTTADVDPGTELVVVETNMGMMSQAGTDAFESANLDRAGTYVSGTKAGCSVLTNGTPLGAVQANITPDQLSQIALTAQAVTVRYQYVIAVGH